MGLFSWLFKPKVGDESKETIALLSDWEQTHFQSDDSLRYRYSSDSSNANDASRYAIFIRDTNDKVSLSKMYLPINEEPQQVQPKGFFERLKDLIDPSSVVSSKPTVSGVVAEHRKMLYDEIQNFKGNVIRHSRLSHSIREDSFFFEIDHVFDSKLKILYNELQFCQFEKLGDFFYLEKMRAKIYILIQDMQTINSAFSDYMYALTSIQYENTAIDLENIKTRVTSMLNAAGVQ